MKKILLFLLSIKAIINDKFIRSSYQFYSNQYYIRFKLGTVPISAFQAINTNLTRSWTFKYFYHYSESTTSTVVGEDYLSEFSYVPKQPAKEVLDTITFLDNEKENELKVNNFRFYSADITSISREFNHGVAFAFQIDEKFSLVHLLYNSGLISRRAFAFSPNNYTGNPTINYIIYGGMPEKDTVNAKAKGNCDALEDEKAWSCKINKISFKNHSDYQANTKIIFNPYTDAFVFTSEFYDLFTRFFYADEIKDGMCFDNDLTNHFVCKDKYFKKEGNISFSIGDFEMTFDINSLFGKSKTHTYSSFLKGTDVFVMGAPFLNYFAIEFDYEDKKVSFYENNTEVIHIFHSKQAKKSKRNKVEIFIFLLLIFCISGVILNIGTLYLSKKTI